VLSYTKILHTRLPMGPVDLDRLVRDIVEAYPDGHALRPQIQITGTLPQVHGNEALLTQCVSNLLNNGAKFVPPGTIPHLEIWAEQKDGATVESAKVARESVKRIPSDLSTMPQPSNGPVATAKPGKAGRFRVWFKDNGLGIAPENHERIFRLFERIHPVDDYEGTGIGLTIVRKAVERMGGEVGFESELGKGSSFWIDLKKG
jgi:signal transduction histidine kinase